MPDWRKATERAARRHGVDPKVLTALVQQESGGRQNVTSPAGARDIAQFVPATAKAYGVTLGDNRISDDLDGAARYLKANLKRTGGDYRAALSIYNSGKPDGYKHIPETKAYVAKIMGAAGSVPAPVRAAGAVSKGATLAGTSPPVTPGGMDRQGLLSQYLATRGQPGGLAALGAGLGSLRAPQAPQTADTPRPVSNPMRTAAQAGAFKITGPNPSRLKPQLVSFAKQVAGVYGRPLTGSDGTGHSRLTVNGNVSQHSTGNATDIPAAGAQLVKMGQAALIAAGMPPAQARKQRGGLFNVGAHQIIFNTHEGGDHTDHLHISAR